MLYYNIVEKDSTSYLVNIINEVNEVLFSNDFNPETGEDFTSYQEAEQFAKNYIKEIQMSNIDPDNPLLLIVNFYDFTDTSIIKKKAKVNEPVYIEVKIVSKYDNNPIPLNGKYLVPYFDKYSIENGTYITAGTVEIEMVNGVASKVIKFPRPGSYTVVLDKILNAETMKQPYPLPDFAEDISLVVVE